MILNFLIPKNCIKPVIDKYHTDLKKIFFPQIIQNTKKYNNKILIRELFKYF